MPGVVYKCIAGFEIEWEALKLPWDSSYEKIFEKQRNQFNTWKRGKGCVNKFQIRKEILGFPTTKNKLANNTAAQIFCKALTPPPLERGCMVQALLVWKESI